MSTNELFNKYFLECETTNGSSVFYGEIKFLWIAVSIFSDKKCSGEKDKYLCLNVC